MLLQAVAKDKRLSCDLMKHLEYYLTDVASFLDRLLSNFVGKPGEREELILVTKKSSRRKSPSNAGRRSYT